MENYSNSDTPSESDCESSQGPAAAPNCDEDEPSENP
jgi:hypothetical protein